MKKILTFLLSMVLGLCFLSDLTGIDQQKRIDQQIIFKAPNLKGYIFSVPGNGCCWNPASPSPLDSVITAFFDPDIYVKNEGSARSTGGKAKVEYFNLLTCSNVTYEVAIPPLNPGEWVAITTGQIFYIAKKADGIKLTLTYVGENGKNYTYSRIVKNCPDHY